MNLTVLSSRKKMAELGDIQKIEKAINDYFAKFEGWKTYLLYHDNPPSPIDPVEDDPEAIKSLISYFEERFLPIDYLVILGGDEIIPFSRLDNPCEDDDRFVLSDNPYASRDDEYLIPERAIGRIPSGGDVDFLIKNLNKQSNGDESFGLSAEVWSDASQVVYEVVGNSDDLKLSPPVTIENFKKSWIETKRYLYFNVHGSDKSPYWYGQKGSSFPRALSPELTLQGGGVVGSEACYGTYIIDRKIEESIALSFLSSPECVGVVGSTSIAYGPFHPPSSEADRLIKYFFQYVENGLDFGSALKSAKIDFARKKIRWKGFLDEDDQKTLIQFILLGDPTRRITNETGMD